MPREDFDRIVETDVENFVGFVQFIANNDLWNTVKEALAQRGVERLRVSGEPIAVIRELVVKKLIADGAVEGRDLKHAENIAASGCGVTNPGPPGGPPKEPKPPKKEEQGAPQGPDDEPAHPPRVYIDIQTLKDLIAANDPRSDGPGMAGSLEVFLFADEEQEARKVGELQTASYRTFDTK